MQLSWIGEACNRIYGFWSRLFSLLLMSRMITIQPMAQKQTVLLQPETYCQPKGSWLDTLFSG